MTDATGREVALQMLLGDVRRLRAIAVKHADASPMRLDVGLAP
jgi:hypothetical protein